MPLMKQNDRLASRDPVRLDIPYLNIPMYAVCYQIFKSDFFVINFSYFVIRFLLNSSIVKSDNEIGNVNDKKKYDSKI